MTDLARGRQEETGSAILRNDTCSSRCLPPVRFTMKFTFEKEWLLKIICGRSAIIRANSPIRQSMRNLVLFFVLAAAVFAQALPPGVRKGSSIEGITEYTF